jgi:hypothetical protein
MAFGMSDASVSTIIELAGFICLHSVQMSNLSDINTHTKCNHHDKSRLLLMWFITNWVTCITIFMNVNGYIGNSKFIND